LKPERTPLENSVWGTDKSSGTFSTLFRSRLLKAKKYLDQPFEIRAETQLFGDLKTNGRFSHKVASNPIMDLYVTERWEDFAVNPKAALVLNGDGGSLPIPDQCVDAVVTDPPYFDFVHYSELSDFFYAWLQPALKDVYSYFSKPCSFREGEVQDRDPDNFTSKLTRVFQECHRVLRDNGILSFSFHHSRREGWLSIYKAISGAGFQIVAAHPIYGEMKGGNPKSATRTPITIDAILVCKKSLCAPPRDEQILDKVQERVIKISHELTSSGITLSEADMFVIKMSQAISLGSISGYTVAEMSTFLEQFTSVR
jgi:putative DNA methylase